MAFEEVSTKREICGSMSQQLSASVVVKEETSEPLSTSEELGENGKANKGFNSNNSSLPTETPSGARQIGESNGTDTGISNSAKVVNFCCLEELLLSLLFRQVKFKMIAYFHLGY